jgi:hypothetical protein
MAANRTATGNGQHMRASKRIARDPPQNERRSKRSRHSSGFYDEDDSEPSEDDETFNLTSPSVAGEAQSHVAPRSRKVEPSHGHIHEAQVFDVGELHQVSDLPAHQPGVTPPWVQLPYLIIVRIIGHAANPLDSPVAVKWLVQAGRVCRAFAEPAMTVLYASPPLLTIAMAHNFVAQLGREPSETLFNYRVKVRRLEVDVGLIATRSYRGRALDFKSLLQHSPMLGDVELFHRKDMAPYRQLDHNLKWNYPASLFEGLGIHPSKRHGEVYDSSTATARLRSWTWSSRMMAPKMLATLPALHGTAPFNHLQSIRLVNFQLPSLRTAKADPEELTRKDQECVQHIAVSIAALPSLMHLAFESSTVVNEMLLPLLPKRIKSLELINCWEVKAEDFSEYLLSHGHDLQSLQLDHNQSLSLRFLTSLETACPNLRQLSMDLAYYNHHEFYNDSDPMYETLLLPDDRPTWPATVESISLENLRKWGPEAAERLFESLIRSAPKLPALRYLSIKAMLDIPWRQRSQMRNHWPAVLSKVFARPVTEPTNLSARRAVLSTTAHISSRSSQEVPSVTSASPKRRSQRLVSQPSAPSPRKIGPSRALRERSGSAVRYAESDTDEEPEGQEDTEPLGTFRGPAQDASSAEFYVQGLCEVVDIRLDNQKPMERQYGMDDFLDTDDEEDEEWNGDDNAEDGYAW